MPARGVAAFGVAIRFGLLLSSAAALPVSWQCNLISVYRQSPQCGERSNAAFRTQSAVQLPSLAPHDSKARLISVTNSRDSWRSHVHRTYTAQRVQSFKLQSSNVGGRGGTPLVLSLGGVRGIFSFEKENIPLLAHFRTVREFSRCLQAAKPVKHYCFNSLLISCSASAVTPSKSTHG